SSATSAFMFCPLCKAEYRDGFTRCSNCDTDLVSSLDSSETSTPGRGPVLAWRGDDPVALSRVLAALQEAQIPSYQIPDHDHLAYQPTVPRPRCAIFVRSDDGARAAQRIREIIKGQPPE
ncbi:MAG TPA: hypothetical protein VEX69_03395, partial [Candidatus Limnocylindria bacterium]|nr:hypothetical protein [Candidatus Limnocylindria bacterium]